VYNDYMDGYCKLVEEKKDIEKFAQ